MTIIRGRVSPVEQTAQHGVLQQIVKEFDDLDGKEVEVTITVREIPQYVGVRRSQDDVTVTVFRDDAQ